MTIVVQDGQEIAAMYRQHDGYPDGHGLMLGHFLGDRTLVNGLRDSANVFNGASCLAAQLVAHFKTGPGGIYLHPAGKRLGEDYRYYILCTRPPEGIRVGTIAVRVTDDEDNVLFRGEVAEFREWCSRQS